jgi:hypothetical protein
MHDTLLGWNSSLASFDDDGKIWQWSTSSIENYTSIAAAYHY